MSTPAMLPWSARRHATERPGAAAVVDGGVTWTWSELDARIDRIVAGLEAVGIPAGERIGLLAPASAGALAMIHSLGRAGAVAVPLNARLTRAELGQLLDEVGVRWVVVGEGAGGARLDATVGLDVPAGVGVGAVEPGLRLIPLQRLLTGDRPATARAEGLTDPGTTAVVVVTSGTTGRPKGALLTHGQLAASAAAWIDALPPATGWLAALSFAHVAGLGIIWRAAAAGVPVVVERDGDPASLRAALSTPRVSHVSLVAVQLARLLDATADGSPPEGLRAVLLGGGPVPPSLVRRGLAAGWPLVTTYGMTETASAVTALPTAEAGARPWSAGRPLPGARLRVVRPGPDGIGEIEVAGPMVFGGYVGRPDVTSNAFTADGWYRTGDLGALDDDGFLTVADRRLDLIVSGGENVYPAEVETVLAEHPAVADAGVAAQVDPTWGAVPVAIVAFRPGASATDAALDAFCRARLASYKVPVAFVRVDVVPRAASGKLRRDELQRLLSGNIAAPSPELAAPSAVSPATSPEAAPRPAPAGSPRATPGPSLRHLARPDGVRIAYRRFEGPGAAGGAASLPAVLLLHATLSSGDQLGALARLISERTTVLVPDRRGSGASRLDLPRPVPLEDQVADCRALLDRERVERAVLVGHSFGGVVALAFAASEPARVAGVVAYEPPVLHELDPALAGAVSRIPQLVTAAYERGGVSAAAETFLRIVNGDEAFEGLPPRLRASLLAEGAGVLADVGPAAEALLDPARIAAPVTLVTGGASEPFYRLIVERLAPRLRHGGRVDLEGPGHLAPITEPAALAAIVVATLDGLAAAAAGNARSGPARSQGPAGPRG